jgi:hypothetical protein
MKTSIFDMNFTLPPVVEMSEVVKNVPYWTGNCSYHIVAGFICT